MIKFIKKICFIISVLMLLFFEIQDRAVPAFAAAAEVKSTAVSDSEFLELCKYGTARDVELAIKSGANINARDDDNNNMTALMCAAYIAQNPDIVRALVKAGADVNARAQYDWTALMLAAMRNSNTAIINILIKAGNLKSGADVNARDNEGHSVLIYAAGFNKSPKAIDIVTELLKAGANINIKDNQGKTAYDYVNDPEILYKVGMMYINGKGVKRDNSMGIKWLRKAAMRGHKAADKEIASSGVMSSNDFLDLCRTGTVQDVSYAIRTGSDIKAVNDKGESALIIASKYNKNPDVIIELIKAGSDVTFKDKDDKIALDYINNPALLYRIGMLFARANGVEEDQWEAVNWLRKAAQLGHKPSRNELARRRIYN